MAHRIRDALFFSREREQVVGAVEPGVDNLANQRYSYIVFGAFALVYFWYYLPQGFTINDDAYLLSVGKRIVGGQRLYTDFYYLRTPLSPLIQSVWITLFGDHYTFLFSRIIWGLQLCSTIVIFSFIYRRWLSAISLAVVLCATLVYSSLLFAFPWYTYDGMFFTALFAYFAFKRRFLLAGFCAGLAFLCKQGFVVLLPVFLLLSFLEAKRMRANMSLWRNDSIKAIAGALVALVLVILALDASLADIWHNVFVLPKRISHLSLPFMFYQDLPHIALEVWPLAAPLFIILVAPLKFKVRMTALAVWLILSWSQLNSGMKILPWVLSLVSFVVIGWFYIQCLRHIRSEVKDAPTREILTISALALTVSYAAGFNYSGWVFSYIGAGISLPVLALWSSSWSSTSSHVASEDKDGRLRGWVFQAIVGSVLLLSISAHHLFPYDHAARWELTTPFSVPALAGVYADSATVGDIDDLVTGVLERTRPGDSILAFPTPASLSFLTGRPAWGAIQWHYELEFDSAMAEQSASLLYESPPALVVLTDPEHIFQLPKFDLIYDAILDNFQPVDTAGPFHILIPLCPQDSGSAGNDTDDDK